MSLSLRGWLPQGETRVEFINSVMRFEGSSILLRGTVAAMMGQSLEELLADQGAVNERYGKSHGQLLETIDGLSKKLVETYLQGDGAITGRGAGLLFSGI